MEILAILIIVGVLIFGHQIASNRREAELVRRLGKIHDPNAAAAEVDAMVAQAKQESQFQSSFNRLRFW